MAASLTSGSSSGAFSPDLTAATIQRCLALLEAASHHLGHTLDVSQALQRLSAAITLLDELLGEAQRWPFTGQLSSVPECREILQAVIYFQQAALGHLRDGDPLRAHIILCAHPAALHHIRAFLATFMNDL